jgi:hypothetical protein
MNKSNPTTKSGADSLSDTVDQLCDLVHDGAKLSVSLIEELCQIKEPCLGTPLLLPKLFCSPLLQLPKLCALPALPALSLLTPVKGKGHGKASGCGCDIPPPCWAPKPMGCVESGVCPGATATVRIHVTNCGATARTMTFQAVGLGVTFAPASLALGPMERGRVVATVTLPADAELGSTREVLVWVRGCHDHYLRWTLHAWSSGECGCEEVHVSDCPDYVHHWYDHFYCNRPWVHQG